MGQAAADSGISGAPDLGIEPDAGSSAEGPCPSYAGIRLGRRWERRSTAAFEAEYKSRFHAVMEVVAINDRGNYTQVLMRSTSISETATTRMRTDSDIEARCDSNGYSSASSKSRTQFMQSGMTSNSGSEFSFSPPLLTLPSNPQPGDRWGGKHLVSTISITADGMRHNSSYEMDWSALANDFQTITVPAGQYRALRVIGTRNGNSSEEHWVENIGLVFSGGIELVNVQ